MTKSKEDRVKLDLKRPIEAHGEEVSVLHFREPTVKDLRKTGYPVTGNSEINVDAAVNLIAACADIPPSSVEKMKPTDFTSAVAVIGDFLAE